MAHLGDDGTMDTVIVCDDCGREHRFNFSNEGAEYSTDFVRFCGHTEYDDTCKFCDSAKEMQDSEAYDEFVAECMEQVDSECEHKQCPMCSKYHNEESDYCSDQCRIEAEKA